MLTLADIEEGLSKLNGWALDGQSISKEIEFKDFGETIVFLDKIKTVVDKEKHYPTIFIDETRVRLILMTRAERGLSKKDFEIAEAIDKM